MTLPPNRQSRVQSVERAFSVLNAVSEGPGSGSSASMVAAETGLDRTVVHRLLKTLAAEGLVIGVGARYTLGPRTLILGQSFIDRHPVRRAILPFAIDLHARLIDRRPWIISISLPVMDRVVIVERIWGRSTPLSALLEVGSQFPMDGTASGRALLAAFDDRTGKRLLGTARWNAVEPQLSAIRHLDGLSVVHGELRPGMSAIALALGNSPSESAALVLAGTDLTDQARPDSDVVQELRSAVYAAEAALRHSGLPSEAVAG